ncbi:hypothetical protein ACFVVA_08895 [Kitasatospora sp. NPDC058048]|uniref:hypothetical protein n=1 Tax=Kitasatospora sp. NPDC058048 TaxID=3346313 RepID=UPI0036DAFD5A
MTDDDRFQCLYCGGTLEASAPLCFVVRCLPDGTATADLSGLELELELSTVRCADCGRDASKEQDRIITDAMWLFTQALTGTQA